MRRLVSLSALILIALSLASCYDAREIGQQLHVLVIGVDQGRADKWRLTLQIMMVSASDSKDSGSNPSQTAKIGEEDVLTVDAPSFFGGMNLLNTLRSRKISLSHAHVIVFSEELAKSGKVNEFIAPINRFIEIRPSARVIVVKGRADEFLKENTPLLGSLVSEDLQLLLDRGKETGFFPVVTLNQFSGALRSVYEQPIATLGAINEPTAFPEKGQPWGTEFKPDADYTAGEVPRKGENKTEFLGTAIFRGDKMVAELTGEETRYMLMARGEFERGFFTVQDPLAPHLVIPLDVKKAEKTKVAVNITGPHPVIDLKISLNVDILAIQSEVKYEQPELKAFLEGVFADIVQSGVVTIIKKCQSLNVDVFLFGNHAAGKFLVIEDLEAYKWNERFHEALINVKVEVAIRRTGRLLRF